MVSTERPSRRAMRRLTSVSVPPQTRDSRLARRSMSSRSASVICENRLPRSTRSGLVVRKSSITDCMKPIWRLPWTQDDLPTRPNLRQRRMVFVETFSCLLISSSVTTRVVQQADHFTEIACQVGAVDQQVRVGVGAVVGDSETDERYG